MSSDERPMNKDECQIYNKSAEQAMLGAGRPARKSASPNSGGQHVRAPTLARMQHARKLIVKNKRPAPDGTGLGG
jgi:hypothetical protein